MNILGNIFGEGCNCQFHNRLGQSDFFRQFEQQREFDMRRFQQQFNPSPFNFGDGRGLPVFQQMSSPVIVYESEESKEAHAKRFALIEKISERVALGAMVLIFLLGLFG